MATTVTLKPNAIDISGSTSGTTTLQATAVAGTTTLTLPAATDTLVGKATTDTLTNKTLTSPTLASPNITTALTLTGASGTSGQLLTSAGSGSAPIWSTVSGDTVGFKNRIINGAMVIDQRNAGASVTPTNGQYLVDRFTTALTQASKFTAQQSTTAPVGFTNSLKITSSSAYSVVSADYFGIGQVIEGFNVADLGWGTANAKTVTLSFQVYSSLTGTFGGAIFNDSANRSYPFTYTISSANTWTTASVTIAGDTTGTWTTNNSGGMKIYFNLGTGSTYSGTAGAWAGTFYISATGATSVVGTNGATFYITGVQLEKGSTATSFDYRPYGTELALCQRYFQQKSGFVVTTSSIYQAIHFPVLMRVPPTIGTVTFDGGTNATFTVNNTYGYTNAYQTANHSTTATVTSFPLSAEL